MASALHRLSVTAIRGAYRIRPRRIIRPPIHPLNNFHTAITFRKDNSNGRPDGFKDAIETFTNVSQEEVIDEDKTSQQSEINATSIAENDATAPSDPSTTPIQSSSSANPLSIDDLPFETDDAFFEELMSSEPLTPEELADHEEATKNLPPEAANAINALRTEMSEFEAEMFRELDREIEEDEEPPPEKRFRPGIMAMGEEDEQDEGDDETFEGDDISSHAHGELEQHREMRNYARIAAWEMPLLSKLAKPFELPGTDRPLRFRYTTYLGEEHPAEKKVVLEFSTADLPLEPKQRLKLIKIVGVRYNPQTDIVKMSCEMFETQAQNKRYLGDLVDTLMMESRNQSDAEGGTDAFDDVPVDFRHVKWKTKPQFPETWKLTPERKAQLKRERAERAQAEAERIENGEMVNGAILIKESLKAKSDFQFRENSKVPKQMDRMTSRLSRPMRSQISRPL